MKHIKIDKHAPLVGEVRRSFYASTYQDPFRHTGFEALARLVLGL
jgi:hypothetical protein